MQSVVVTGATGFIGKRLCEVLENRGCDVKRIIRNSESQYKPGKCVAIGGMDGNTNWTKLVAGYGCVVHLAARVHVMANVSRKSQDKYWQTNVSGTLRLAHQAVAVGVQRFVYMSSIKVNGETTYEEPFRPEDDTAPVDFYGQSKHLAEKGLQEIAAETGLEVVIIRPPLVYGPEVKANFLRLLKWVHNGVPLPFGAVDNKRSFVYVDNLTDFIIKCVVHPAAAGETFLVSDGVDLSTSELIQKLAFYMNYSARLIPVPIGLLRLSARALGRTAQFERLCGSLQVDISKAERLLDWHPPVAMDMGLKNTVSWYLRKNV
ncbi:MAG: hypothetical protein VR65_07900 [Desulfobulbaceae bacterium BRH_c16a]|nr:MAG: hypothetical protein VR65_07900 [Desulfobulbaceae bacterium BRH_c16a]